MAGNYADPVSWRMALDRDGSKFVYGTVGGAVYDLTGTDVTAVADESSTTKDSLPGFNDLKFIGVVFPEKRDIDAFFISATGTNGSLLQAGTVQVSVDTTNGQDGVWTTFSSGYVPHVAADNWRTAVTTGTALAQRGLRLIGPDTFGGSVELRTIHVYGEIAPGENPDRLAFWDGTVDLRLGPAVLDWGDVPRGGSADKTVRVKNLSSTKTASNVRIAFDILTDGSPSVSGQQLVSYGGSAFAAQVNIGSLAPGAISGPVTLRRVTPTSAQLGLFSPRVSATADTFA